MRLMFIFLCTLVLQSQRIDSSNEFSQEEIPSEEPVFIELTRNLNIDGDQHDVFPKVKGNPIWSIQIFTPLV